MFTLSPYLDALLSSLPTRPIAKEALDELVAKTLQQSQERSTSEGRKSQWEFLLKNEVFKLAATKGAALKDPQTSYHDQLRDILDVVLTFTEQDACEQTFPFTVLQDLLESQTIASCSHIFSWIEERSSRLTEGMVPQKGKALVLLRTLNDLLRRLSKTGKTTIFCGRILTFLSGVFPLGERSGVNLRGEYGPQWEGVQYKTPVEEETMEADRTAEEKPDAMEVDESQGDKKVSDGDAEKKEVKPTPTKPAAEKSEEEKKKDFFYTFWSLQLQFSRPTLFSQAETLPTFKAAVETVMPVIKEATVKERAMMGSKAVIGTLKRKRDEPTASTASDEVNRNYFFAKFLTSPDLLDLELSDTVFRRQFLFQLLILLSHLLQFTKTEKATWTTNRNRSLQMDFTLEPADVKWVQDMMAKAFEELRQTAPNGRSFADTVQTILERERNWVRWKNDLCSPFDKEPLPVSLEESTAPLRAKMREEPEEWKYKLGTEALTEIWEMGYRDLSDLQTPFIPGEVKDFVKDIEKENARIALRKQQLSKQAQRMNEARARATASKAASPAPPVLPAPPTATTAADTAISTPVVATVASASSPATPIPALPRMPMQSASPLHPSLPAKPGVVKPDARPVTPTPKPVQIPTPVPVPAPSPAPVSTTPIIPPTPVIVAPPEPADPMIAKAEENKDRISWLALRTARDLYLHHFSKIGNGDVILLSQEIEKEKEREQRGDSAGLSVDSATGVGAERDASPTGSGDRKSAGNVDEDVKMEEVKAITQD